MIYFFTLSVSEELGISGAVILIFSFIISAAISMRFKNRINHINARDYINTVFNIIVIASGSALIIWDVALQLTAFIHWLVLLIYISLIIILSSLHYIGKMRFPLLLISVFSAIMVFLMLVDILFNLPISSYYNSLPGIGVSYLLGFGQPGTASLFWVSLTFVLTMVCSALQSILSAILYIKSK